MDAVTSPLTLTTEEAEILSRLAEGSPPASSRATAILALAESADRDRAVDLSGLTAGQVRYWLGRFRSGRLSALVATVLPVDAPASKAGFGNAEETSPKAARAGGDQDAGQPSPRRAKQRKKDLRRAAGKGKGKAEKKPKKAQKETRKSAKAAKGGKKESAKGDRSRRPTKPLPRKSEKKTVKKKTAKPPAPKGKNRRK